ncbi:MAG: retroviral-like aspartic protease family protein [Aridibacter sp.]
MGEVRVTVKLTNATDLALSRRGKLDKNDVRFYEADAMVDTGSVQTVIPYDVVSALGLQTPEKRGVEYADGRNEIVPVTEAILIEVSNRRTSDEAVVLGEEILIGQTILEKVDLHIDYAKQVVIPNPAHPITKVK